MLDRGRSLLRPFRGLGMLAVLGVAAALLSPLGAQPEKKLPPPEEKPVALKNADLSLLAGAGCSYLICTPAEALDHPLARHLPPQLRDSLNQADERMPRMFGVSPREVGRFVLAFPTGGMTQPVAIFAAAKAFKSDEIRKNLEGGWKEEEKNDLGGLVFRGPAENNILVYRSEQMLLYGQERDVKRFLDRAAGQRGDPALTRGLAAAEAGAHLVVGLRPDDLVAFLPPRRVEVRPNVAPKEEYKRPVPVPKGEFKRGPYEKNEKDAPPPPSTPPTLPGAGPGAFPQPGPGGPPGGPGSGPPAGLAPQPGVGGPFPPPPPPPPPAPGREFAQEPGRDFAPPTVRESLRNMPPEAMPYKPLLLARTAVLAVKLEEDSARVTLSLGYGQPGEIEDGAASLRVALYVLREVLPRWLIQEIGLDRENALETVRAVDQFANALRQVEIRTTDRSVDASVSIPLNPITLKVLLHNTSGFSFDAERKNNLKQIGLALHNYHDTMGALPGTAYYSAQGKPLLSWRVAILPYIEQENLYREFKLDEPWDSEHNKKLLDRMPKVFAPPAGMKVAPGHTFIQGFSGAGTIFDPQLDRKQVRLCIGSRLTDITDGTSNTAMVGESGNAVPWTKPEDIPCDVRGVPALGFVPGSDRCLVLTGDGAVHTITNRPPRDLFQTFTGRHDGMVFSIDDLKPGRNRP